MRISENLKSSDAGKKYFVVETEASQHNPQLLFKRPGELSPGGKLHLNFFRLGLDLGLVILDLKINLLVALNGEVSFLFDFVLSLNLFVKIKSLSSAT